MARSSKRRHSRKRKGGVKIIREALSGAQSVGSGIAGMASNLASTAGDLVSKVGDGISNLSGARQDEERIEREARGIQRNLTPGHALRGHRRGHSGHHHRAVRHSRGVRHPRAVHPHVRHNRTGRRLHGVLGRHRTRRRDRRRSRRLARSAGRHRMRGGG